VVVGALLFVPQFESKKPLTTRFGPGHRCSMEYPVNGHPADPEFEPAVNLWQRFPVFLANTVGPILRLRIAA